MSRDASEGRPDGTEEQKGPDLTPMIDVTFLILVFFLCTIKFKTLEGKLDSYLPKDAIFPISGGWAFPPSGSTCLSRCLLQTI